MSITGVYSFVLPWLWCFGALLAGNALAQAASERVYTIDDMFALTEIGKIAPSPDGETFAVVVLRPMTAAERYGAGELFLAERADIWLVGGTGEARNITNGAEDGSSYWSPVWSPDGERLAMLSTKGGDSIRLFVWEKATDEVKRLTDQAVDVEMNAGGTGSSNRVAATWVNDRDLVTAVLAEGEIPFRYFTANPQGVLTPLWEEMQAGVEATVSTLEGGVVVPEDERPDRNTLILIDTVTKEQTVLMGGHTKTISVSPDGRFIAITAATEGKLPSPDEPLAFPARWNGYTWEVFMHYKVGVLALDIGSSVRWVSGVVDPGILSPLDFPRWSPASDSFAVLAKTAEDEDTSDSLFVVSAVTAEARRVGPEEFSVSDFAWQAETLLAYSNGAWHSVNSDDPEAPLTLLATELEEVPDALFQTSDGHVMGLAGGELAILEGDTVRKVMEDTETEIDYIIWPSAVDMIRGSVTDLIVDTSEGLRHVALQGATVELTPLTPPNEDAWLEAYAAATQQAVFHWVGPDGTFLWVWNSGSGDYSLSFALNEHLAEIPELERRLIDYQSASGEDLKGFVLLPPGYSEGQPVPLIVDVYPDRIIYSTDRYNADKNFLGHNNLHRFTSQGYAVLVPSMPIPKGAEPIDPMFEMSKGVLPAVDKLVRLGIADPERLGLLGHSYGGYAALSILTETDRFKAAVVAAPYSDLAAYHDTIHLMRRYEPFAHELSYLNAAEFEDPNRSVLRLLNTPYEDFERYARNSPVRHLDKIETPLLLVHGELDGVPIAQSEAVFMGLHRLGKRVSFARYWGESHNFSSPANVRDYWERSNAWFDTFFEEGE